MTPQDIKDLIPLVENGSGENRELDKALHETLCERMYESVIERGGDYCLRYYPGPPNPEYYRLPRYVASIDAAIALQERLLPEWQFEQLGWEPEKGGVCFATIGNFGVGDDYRCGISDPCKTPSRALLAATLRAVLATMEK